MNSSATDFANPLRHQDLARSSSHHETRRQVYVISQSAEGPASEAAVRADAHGAAAQPELDRVQEEEPIQLLLDLQRGAHRAAGVIFMDVRRPKGCKKVAALVADGKFQQHTFVAPYDSLHLRNDHVQFFPGVFIVVVIDAQEADK